MIWFQRPAQDPDEEVEEPWELTALKAYEAAGGTSVIYVGERHENIETLGGPLDVGQTASRKFQIRLHSKFALVQQVAIPTWLYCVDDLTVWTLK